MSRLQSDLRASQQEKEALKQEVMSLHKQLQNANEKVTGSGASGSVGFACRGLRTSDIKLI